MSINLTGQLEVDVEEASLPRARKQIEQGLADIQIGGGGGGTGISGQLSRDVSAAQDGNSFGDAVQVEQLSVLEDIKDAVERGALSAAGGGGGGGGAGGGLLDLAILRRLGGRGGGGVLSAAGSALGGASALGAGAVGAGIGIPAIALGGILSDDSANYDAGQQLEENRQDGAGVVTPDQAGTEQLNQRLNNLQASVPEALKNPTLEVPAFLRDLELQVPAALQDLSIGIPQTLQDPPQIGFNVPPALQDLFGSGGGGDGVTEPTGPGGGVDLATGFPSQGGQDPFDLSLDDIGFNIDIDLQRIQRDIEQAIQQEFRSASLRRDVADIVQEQLQREFVP